MSRSLEFQVAELKRRLLHRTLREIDSPQQPDVVLANSGLINFSSNDYLGLAGESFLREAAKAAIDRYGVGSGASRLICGTMKAHVDLERKVAEFKRAQASITFSSGYAAAVGTINALVRREDVVIMDKLAHASLIDGARLSGAVIRVFPHNHLGKLESHLRWAAEHYPEGRHLIITESVFSMDGDRAPLAEMVEIKDKYGAMLMVDEAHAVGVLGKQGRGLAEKLGVAGSIEVQMGTFSKALGVSGGYICGSHVLIDFLINRARSFVYSTAPPPALAVAAAAAIDFLMSEEGTKRQMALWKNLELLRVALPGDLRPKSMDSAIVPILVGGEDKALAAAQWLLKSGFLVPAIRYPTVAKGAARLRITISAAHTVEQIEKLAACLARWPREIAPAAAQVSAHHP